MFVSDADVSEIINIVQSLSNSKSTGVDGLSSSIIKNTITEIAAPLATVFNKSINIGQFPDALKIGKIIPIHKCEDNKLLNNYRPISVLPIFSKVLERLMYNRLLAFLNKNNILAKNQYGFREKHSTSMALLQLVDDISKELDNKNNTIGIFIDLSKAFDTIDHSLLLKKLARYGVRGIVLDWFQNYLTNRKQFVQINDVDSSLQLTTCGVPQGSILGPLLFILYINDLVNTSKLATFIMFADDTNLFFKHNNITVLFDMINIELANISQWFKLNKLSLNIKKTNYILFQGGNREKNIGNLNIVIDNVKIERVEKTKFLGVIINSRLNWNDHIKTVCNKISKNIGILFKIRHNLTPATLLMLYNTMIQPYYEYCNIVWGVGSTTLLDYLFRKQKKALRAIAFAKWDAHSEPIFKKLKILTVYDLNKLQTACFVYKAIHGLLPERFSNLFTKNSEIHEHDTRQKSKLHVVTHRLYIRGHSIQIYGTSLWNSLSQTIVDSPSLHIFKKVYKKFLLNL
jgi:hypothetical protein